MYPLVRLASRNVVKNWRHSLAAMLSIAASFVAFTLFEGYVAHLRNLYVEVFSQRQMMGDLVIEKAGAQQHGLDEPWAFQLDAKDQAEVDRFLTRAGAQVTTRVRFLNFTGMVSNGKSSIVFVGWGYDVPEGSKMRGPKWRNDAVAGRSLSDSLDSAAEEEIVLGQGLGHGVDCNTVDGELKCRRERLQLSAMTEHGQLNAVETGVVGLVDATFKELDARHVRVPLAAAQKLLNTDKVSLYSVRLADHGQAEQFAAALKAAVAKSGVQVDVGPWQQHPRLGDLYRRTMSLLAMFEAFITAVVVVVAGMSVLNTMAKSVSERTREIGLLRSLGFKRKHVVRLFLLEAFFLSTLSCLAGGVISTLVTVAINSSAVMYRAGLLSEPIQLAITLRTMAALTAALILVAVATLATWRPARKASSLSIAKALEFV